jgi:4-diphosphocytidyl-2-C-methyl-D-erythritol kinase
LALNRLWQLKLPRSTLLELAAPLGADVPVFVLGQNAWAEGTGDVLTPLTLPKRWYVIVQPQCEVSTAEIFAQPELTRHTAPITVQAFFSGAGSNDLQAVVLSRYPEVKQAWEWLYKQSSTACMTGSGACLFAALETREEAEVIAAIAPQGLKVNVAEGLDKLPPMQEVA